jgi:hypothetical protein
MNRVKCSRVWSLTDGYSPAVNEEFEVLRDYSYNGEGWYRLCAADGTRFDAPSIFYDDI